MDEIENTLNRIKKYFEDLEKYGKTEFSDMRDFYATSMIVFSIVNESIVLAELFMSSKAMAAPLTYKEMMDELARKKFIDTKLASKMKLLITMRNLIAHEYGEVKKEDVAKLTKKIGIVRQFAAALIGKYKNENA